MHARGILRGAGRSNGTWASAQGLGACRKGAAGPLPAGPAAHASLLHARRWHKLLLLLLLLLVLHPCSAQLRQKGRQYPRACRLRCLHWHHCCPGRSTAAGGVAAGRLMH